LEKVTLLIEVKNSLISRIDICFIPSPDDVLINDFENLLKLKIYETPKTFIKCVYIIIKMNLFKTKISTTLRKFQISNYLLICNN